MTKRQLSTIAKIKADLEALVRAVDQNAPEWNYLYEAHGLLNAAVTMAEELEGIGRAHE